MLTTTKYQLTNLLAHIIYKIYIVYTINIKGSISKLTKLKVNNKYSGCRFQVQMELESYWVMVENWRRGSRAVDPVLGSSRSVDLVCFLVEQIRLLSALGRVLCLVTGCSLLCELFACVWQFFVFVFHLLEMKSWDWKLSREVMGMAVDSGLQAREAVSGCGHVIIDAACVCC